MTSVTPNLAGSALPLLLAACVLASACGEPSSPTTKSEQSDISDSLESDRKLAESGNVEAQLKMARRHINGDGVAKDEQLAFYWNELAAKQGNSGAMVAVGESLIEGNGVTKDYATGIEWLSKASVIGNSDAQYSLAQLNGLIFPDGVFFPAGFHRIGSKLTPTEQEAMARTFVELSTKAANAGHMGSTVDLARVMLFGLKQGKFSVEPNLDEAIKLLHQAASKGHWDAQWTLATLYQAGYSTIAPKEQESARWWSKLKEQSSTEAQKQIAWRYRQHGPYKPGKLKFDGRELQSAEDANEIAAQWYAKCTKQGDAICAFELFQMTKAGIGVMKDHAEAQRLLNFAATRGVTEAQWHLGYLHYSGDDLVKDYSAAMKWFVLATNKIETMAGAKSANAIGLFYMNGWGVERDLVLAYAWLNIASSRHATKARENLALVEKQLSPDELKEAQGLSSKWKPGGTIARLASKAGSQRPGRDSATPQLASSGTGFFIDASGTLVTNFHVAGECKDVRIPSLSKSAKSIVHDRANDLVVLKIESATTKFAQFPSADGLSQGEEIVAFGFPLDGYLPSTGNISTGLVSALAGPGNNTSLIQISAPIQPGNSGGAVLNRKGNVVGVVVGKADALKVAKITGDIPQNINFAVSGKTVQSFLESSQIGYQKSSGLFSFSKSPVELAEHARGFTVKVECWN